MNTKKELEEIKNKDLTKMTNEELINYKSELVKRASNASKEKKVGLKKLIYTGVSYLFGAAIGYCAARVLMTYIYTGSLDPLLPNLGLALLCGVPIACACIFYRLAKRNACRLSQACNDKIIELDRQIALNDFKRNLEAKTNADETPVFDL